MDGCKLSIIIPIYNSGKYLKTCLQSVITCPFPEVEFILVNDGSTDNSIEICEAFYKQDDRIRIINIKNSGVSEARNQGILQSKGNYLFFLDADDYLDVSQWKSIEKSIELSIDFVAFSYFTLNEDGSVYEEIFPLTRNETTSISELNRIALSTSSLNTCWGKLLKREIIIDNNISFPKEMKTAEDVIFIINYIQHIKTCLLKNESVLFYRQHISSVMHQVDINIKLDDLEILYNYRMIFLKKIYSSILEKDTNRHFFSIVTNLFLELAGKNNSKDVKQLYQTICQRELIKEIINKTPYEELNPIYKKVEYLLIHKKQYTVLSVYFKLKKMFK